jgi:two-component system LytT family sensor kinase
MTPAVGALRERGIRRRLGGVRLSRSLRPWMFVSAAWIGPAIFAAVNHLAQSRLNRWEPPTARELLFESGDWLLYALLTPLVFAISRRWPLTRPHLRKRALLHFAFSLLFCVAWATLGKLLQLVLALTLEPQVVRHALATGGDRLGMTIGRDVLSWIFTTLPFGVAVYLCMVGMEHAIRYFMEAREREVQVALLSGQLAGARLAALQAQLNPHFLFNSLNTINVLVRDGDSATAVRVIEQLSDVLRSTLHRTDAHEVSLAEELSLVRQYLAVEQARFSDRLRPEFDIDAGVLPAMIPSFALQHLVENALRHGIARRTDSGRVVVSAHRDGDILEITVADDGAGGADASVHASKHGLENSRARLRALHGGDASLTLEAAFPHGTIARLRLPYRELPSAVSNV